MVADQRTRQLSRRRFVQGAGLAGLGLLAGCGRLPGQAAPARVPRIGFLALAPQPYYDAFPEGLREHGYEVGKNVAVEYRYADGREERLPQAATELVGLPVDLILAAGIEAGRAARDATATIPIVLGSSNDPVGTGLIASVARPGGNVTGLTNVSPQLGGKLLELLKETVPAVARVAVLWNAGNSGAALAYQGAQDAAPALGLELRSLEVRGPDDLAGAFELAARDRPDALVTLRDSLTNTYRPRILEFAAQQRLPALGGLREFAAEGGLLAYGPSLTNGYRRAAGYVDRILKGAKPGDLPIEQPMIFDLVLNLKTAQTLGLMIPQHVLLQATEIIQ
jgi:putative ABC transport system substrate-binding protein